MRKIREVLRLKFEAQLSHEQIAGACGISKGVVSKYGQLAAAAALGWPLPEGMDDAALEARLFPRAAPAARFAVPDGALIHQELKRKGVTLQLLWEEYAEANPQRHYQYTQYCHHYEVYRGRLRRWMRQHHRAGEKLFLDYAGQTVGIVDAGSGEIRPAAIFVAVQGASQYAYAEATWGQGLSDWIASHVRTFEFMGVVGALLVPDNLKSAISRACRYEPEANRTYEDMAAHYGAAVLPARPLHPQDKAVVEGGVLLVSRWILAKLRKRTFFSLVELNAAIRPLLVDLNNRPFQKLLGCRASVFDTIDRPAMAPLPVARYEYAQWKGATVNIDYHVQLLKNYYSVPHALIGERVEVRFTDTTVECYFKSKRVAAHLRAHGCGHYVTLPEHMPESHRRHRDWTPTRLLAWAGKIGPATQKMVQWQFDNRPHPEQGYRSCLGLLGLARTYPEARLEAACAHALRIGSPTRKSVKSILDANLDQHPDLFPAVADPATAPPTLPVNDNVRGRDYFDQPEKEKTSC